MVSQHYGDFMHDNIGAPGRLDFLVIEAALNLAARADSRCSVPKENILLGDLFSSEVSQGSERHVGGRRFHALKVVDGLV